MFYNLTLDRKTMKKILIVTIIIVVIGVVLGYQITSGVLSPSKERAIYRVDTDEKIISLTFDVVWNDEYTEELLNTLEGYDLTATFFITGEWMERYPDLTEEILKRGNEIGNHTYSHNSLKELDDEDIRREIEEVDKMLREDFDYQSKFFRPPLGEYNKRVVNIAQEMGYYTVLWSIETGDWLSPGVDKIVDRVVKRAHKGGIILMHNCSPQGISALSMIIHALRLRDFAIVPVSNLLGLVESSEVHDTGGKGNEMLLEN